MLRSGGFDASVFEPETGLMLRPAAARLPFLTTGAEQPAKPDMSFRDMRACAVDLRGDLSRPIDSGRKKRRSRAYFMR
jgi:hypothetical protein